MVGGKGKRLNAFAKASTIESDSSESEDYRVPKMLAVGIDLKYKEIGAMILHNLDQIPAN